MPHIPSAGPVFWQFAPALASVRGGDPGHRPPSYSSYYWSSPFHCWWPGQPASCRSSWSPPPGGLPALFQFHVCYPLLLYERKYLLSPLSCSTYTHTAAVSASRSLPTGVWTRLGHYFAFCLCIPVVQLTVEAHCMTDCWMMSEKSSSGKH